jgi:hypothetical protein
MAIMIFAPVERRGAKAPVTPALTEGPQKSMGGGIEECALMKC